MLYLVYLEQRWEFFVCLSGCFMYNSIILKIFVLKRGRSNYGGHHAVDLVWNLTCPAFAGKALVPLFPVPIDNIGI